MHSLCETSMVNGVELQKGVEVELMQGQIIQLGNDNLFRFNHPIQVRTGVVCDVSHSLDN